MASRVGIDGWEQDISPEGGEDDPGENEGDDDEDDEEQGGAFLLSGCSRPARLARRGALEGAVAPSCAVR
eukprot:1383291-Pyramimonas_sp.AAC.1